MSWYTANLGDAQAFSHPKLGLAYLFGEGRPGDTFDDYGLNIRVLQPGQAASLYHSESVDESFLVLGGECLAIVEDEEVPLRQWEFLHCPPGTHHVIVGAGDRPSWVLMIGSRKGDDSIHFPVSERAARFGASVERETSDPGDAWAQAGLSLADFAPAGFPWPPPTARD